MAQKLGKQTEWPRVKRQPIGAYQHPDLLHRDDRDLVGPLRHGTNPDGVGPKGPAVVADYDQRSSSFGTDMVARDRKIDRKFPSDLLARELRGPGGRERKNIISQGKRFPQQD